MSLTQYFKKSTLKKKNLNSLIICDKNSLIHGGSNSEDHAIIYTNNVAKTVYFYTRAFGLQCEFIHDQINLAELLSGQCILSPAQINKDLVDFSMITKDIFFTFNQALAAGAIVVQTPGKSSDGEMFALVRDGNGFLIEIIQGN